MRSFSRFGLSKRSNVLIKKAKRPRYKPCKMPYFNVPRGDSPHQETAQKARRKKREKPRREARL
jgi:hypothetical protein